MSSPKIFLSYSHEDREWVKAFAEALEERGLPLWYDEKEIKAGDNIADAVESALRESEAVIFVLNDQSVLSPNLYFELGAAVAAGKKIIPIVGKHSARRSLPGSLLKRRSLVQGDPGETADEVLRAVA
ncbi:MAG TPA: toll/interleukin-1 receptor domain-containing protein [Thermoanaerobaculia bacterium]|nr:toll/interleukin-1 receptor domain-containing protein [Thermoanaerobaculia bacterium]